MTIDLAVFDRAERRAAETYAAALSEVQARLPEPRQIETRRLNMVVHDVGAGTPVVLLHGFPELAYSWRYQIDPIVQAGFRVVAPNQRGYGGSDAPADPLSYSAKNLVHDLTGLFDALGIEQAVVIGHDFGGIPAWYSAVYAPDRVLGVGSLCTPYSPRGKQDLLEVQRQIRGPNNYMLTFQAPGVGETLLERDVEATFRALIRRRGMTMEEFQAAPASVREIPAETFIGEPQLFGDELLPEGELAVYVETFSQTGFTGGLNWYRAMHRTWEEAEGHDRVIDKPALMISGRDDRFLPPAMTRGMERWLPHLEKHIIDGAHWIQQENPEGVNSLLVPWLTRNFKA